MKNFTLKALQRLSIAIRDGADTIDKLKLATGHSYNFIRDGVKTLEVNGYITRLYTTLNKRIPTLILTDEGLLLANNDAARLSSVVSPDDPSIMDLCEPALYRQWLGGLKAKARESSKI